MRLFGTNVGELIMIWMITTIFIVWVVPTLFPASAKAADGTPAELSYTDCPKDCEALQLMFSHARTENGEKFCYCGPPEDTREIWGDR
jgi:hypothetical protein